MIHGQAQPPAEQPAMRSLAEYPALAASWLERGVSYAGKAVTEAGQTVVKYFPDARRAKEAGKPTTYLEVSFSLKDIDLAQLVKRTGVKLPYPVSGRGSLEVQAALPVDTPNDLAAYRARGTVQLRRFKLAELALDQVSARVLLDRGVLELTELKGRVPDGREGNFTGTARLQVAPLGDLSARLTLSDIPLARVLSLVPEAANHVSGPFRGPAAFPPPPTHPTPPPS